MALSPAEQALRLVFPGFTFGLDDPVDGERLVDLGVGGFCLYGGEAAEVADFTRRLQRRARRPLLFSADYEDGLGVHVAGATRLPSNMALGASGKEELARLKGAVTAAEARAVGVRWVFGPVLDLASEPENPIVNVRSFGSDPDLVARLGGAFMRGLAEGGALSCAKHFPGHGQTRLDSHLELPSLELTRESLAARELVPFRKTRSLASSVMMAHLRMAAFEDGAGLPASLSKPVVSGLLRGELGYEGLVATDALSMRSVAGRWSDEEACVLALRAGADVLLVPAEPLKACYALSRRAQEDPELAPLVAAAHRRLERALDACGVSGDGGLAAAEGLGATDLSAHRKTADELAAACLTLVRGPAGTVAPRKIRYLEPDAESAADWQGTAFLDELRALGVSCEPYSPAGDGPVIVASFLSPRAYSGRIRFSEEEAASAVKALAEPDSTLVSFGSPFVFDDFKGYRRGLCAFCPLDGAQRAAARVLAGKAEAPGRMPVSLKSAAA